MKNKINLSKIPTEELIKELKKRKDFYIKTKLIYDPDDCPF